MYYAGLRPGEVNALRATDLSRPEEGWGELALNLSDPATSLGWTDEGKREPRQLKHRAEDDVRYVPVVPPVTAILRRHLAKYGTALDGRLFRGPRGGPIAEAIYGRVCGSPGSGHSTPRRLTRRSRLDPTTCATLRSRHGSTPACPRRW
jgi:integrase